MHEKQRLTAFQIDWIVEQWKKDGYILLLSESDAAQDVDGVQLAIGPSFRNIKNKYNHEELLRSRLAKMFNVRVCYIQSCLFPIVRHSNIDKWSEPIEQFIEKWQKFLDKKSKELQK